MGRSDLEEADQTSGTLLTWLQTHANVDIGVEFAELSVHSGLELVE